MDRGGFDAVWLAEHHFTTFSVCPSVHMVGMLAAARTKRLRIGTRKERATPRPARRREIAPDAGSAPSTEPTTPPSPQGDGAGTP